MFSKMNFWHIENQTPSWIQSWDQNNNVIFYKFKQDYFLYWSICLTLFCIKISLHSYFISLFLKHKLPFYEHFATKNLLTYFEYADQYMYILWYFFSTNQDCLASSIIEVSLVVIDLWKIYIYKYITSMLMSSSLIRHRMTMIF